MSLNYASMAPKVLKILDEDKSTHDILDKESSGIRAITYNDNYSYHYQAAAATNVVINAAASYLHSIIIGKDVDTGIIEVSDHASDGDGNVVIHLDSVQSGIYTINAFFETGICTDITTYTNITFIYRSPVASIPCA